MTGLERWWRIFWASTLMLACSAYPAMADILNLSLNDTLSCTGGTGGTGQTLFSNFGGSSPDVQLYGCQGASLGFLASFICLVETTLGMVIAAFFCQLSQAWTEPLGVLIMLYMFVSGVAFLAGIMQMTVRDFAKIMFKVGLIATFALNTDIALQIAYKLFIGVIQDSVAIFWDAFGNGIGFASRDNSIVPTDPLAQSTVPAVSTGEAMGCGFSIINMYALMFIFFLLIAFLPIVLGLLIMAGLSVLGFLARAAFGYLYALVMLTFLVAAMPVFVSFALFSPTRQLFTAWLAYIFSNIVQIMIVFAFLGFAAQVDFLAFLRGLSRLLVTESFTVPYTMGILDFDYCTICEPNIIMVDDIPEIANAPDQCKVVGGKINKIGVWEFPLMTDLIYMLMIKAASLYLIGEVLSDFMKDVPQMSKLLGGSSPMMMISGTPRSGHADNQSAIRAPGLTNATVNAEAGFANAFGLVGARNRVGHGGIIATLSSRNKWGTLGKAIRESGSSIIHGRSMLDRNMVQALERNQQSLFADATKMKDVLSTKTESLEKKIKDLVAKTGTLQEKGDTLKASLAEKQGKYREKMDDLVNSLGSKDEREKFEQQYRGLESASAKTADVKKAYNLFSDADKIEKASFQQTQGLAKAFDALDALAPGKAMSVEQAKEINTLLSGLSSTGIEISTKLHGAGNTSALQSNDSFITAAKRAQGLASKLGGKKQITDKETELMKQSLMNLKLAHSETAIQLRRHFEATQEKYIGTTMERDRHKAEWLFEQMAAKGGDDVDPAKMAAMDDEMIRARNEVMIAKKQIDVHKYDLQKNEAELGSTRANYTAQEKALEEAKKRFTKVKDETGKGLYLHGKTDEARQFLKNNYGIDRPESGGGILDEIFDPDQEYERFFGSKKLQRYGRGKDRYSWLSMMHKAD